MMEDEIAKLKQRMADWEGKRTRTSVLVTLQFGLLLVVVIGSLFLFLTRQGLARDAHPPAAAAPRPAAP